MEEKRKVPKSAKIVSVIFMTMFFVSIVCFIILGILFNSAYNVGIVFGLVGFVLLGISMLVLLHPYYSLWKVFFVDVLFCKKKKDKNNLDQQ